MSFFSRARNSVILLSATAGMDRWSQRRQKEDQAAGAVNQKGTIKEEN